MYPISATMCSGTSRCTVKLHSCTEGFLRLGSNAPTAGASDAGCWGVLKAADGVIVGSGTVVGNPCEILFPVPEGSTQPVVVLAAPELLMLVWQFRRKPGSLPAMAVTWNVDNVSNNQA